MPAAYGNFNYFSGCIPNIYLVLLCLLEKVIVNIITLSCSCSFNVIINTLILLTSVKRMPLGAIIGTDLFVAMLHASKWLHF